MSIVGAPIKARLLCIGVEELTLMLLHDKMPGAEFVRITSADAFGSSFEAWKDGDFTAIFCGRTIKDMQDIEIAQVLMNQCPATLKYFVTFELTDFEPRNLLKNGFVGVFCLPMDKGILKKAIEEKILSEALNQKVYRPVKVLDLGDDEKPLEFDTYLFMPLNKKYVKFSKANTGIDKEKIEKLGRSQRDSIFLDHADMPKFHRYTATRLRDLSDGSGSSTEKREKLTTAVRSILTDVFDQSIKTDLAEGKQMKETCDQIISNFITKGASGDWQTKLMASLGMGDDTYDRASTIATLAALFAMGIGHPHPEDLAMAGLFHDVGLAQIPEEIMLKDPSRWTEPERELYYSHMEKSLFIVKTKRIIIAPTVEKAIMQHHEAFHGRGFPKKTTGDRICEEAQILSFADQFDELTRAQEGHQRMTPIQALELIKKTGTISPELIKRIRGLLEVPADPTGAGGGGGAAGVAPADKKAV